MTVRFSLTGQPRTIEPGTTGADATMTGRGRSPRIRRVPSGEKAKKEILARRAR